jgi:hypothetical protein
MTNFLSEHSSSVQKVSDIIAEIIQENKKKGEDKANSLFFCKAKPAINITEYLMRIVKYAKIEESTLIVALIYIDRLCDLNNFNLTESNIHRVVLLCIICAAKFNEDEIYSNAFYAKIGGISKEELHLLEIEFLKMVKYSLFIKNDLFLQYKAYLKQYKRGK